MEDTNITLANADFADLENKIVATFGNDIMLAMLEPTNTVTLGGKSYSALVEPVMSFPPRNRHLRRREEALWRKKHGSK